MHRCQCGRLTNFGFKCVSCYSATEGECEEMDFELEDLIEDDQDSVSQ